MSFFKMLSRRFMAFMSGRNGFDQLSMAILLCSLLLQFVGSLTGLNVILVLSIALYGWALFRIFSKRDPKRAEENQKFLQLTAKPRKYLKLIKLQWKDRKTHRYFICGVCGQMLRSRRYLGDGYYLPFNTERKINYYLKKLDKLGWQNPMPA